MSLNLLKNYLEAEIADRNILRQFEPLPQTELN